MYISLRKASALQQEILAAMPKFETVASVSIYEALPLATIAQAAMNLTKAMELRSTLMDALYEIRDSVAVANVQSGITKLVSRRARIEKDMVALTQVAVSTPRPSDSIILGKVERLRNAETKTYGFSEETSFHVMPQASLDSVKLTIAELKKEKNRIQDELLEANIKNSIKLSEEAGATLSAAGLI